MLQKVITWVTKHLTDRQTNMLLAFLIGFLASVAAWVLHQLISLIQRLLTEGFATDEANLLYLAFPVIGIYLTYLL